MEIRLVLDDELINTLKNRLHTKNATDVIRESISFLDWATEEAENQRAILSIGEDGEDPRRIEAPALRMARRRAKREAKQPA